MSSLRRLRRKACDGKQRHESHDRAAAHIKSLRHAFGHDGTWLRVYKCKFCKGYHVGHAREPRP